MASEFLSNGSDALQILAQGRSRMVMTSGGIESAPDSAGGTHSVFANVFVQLLRENDGPLLGGKLFRQLRSHLAASAERVSGRTFPSTRRWTPSAARAASSCYPRPTLGT